MHRVLIQYRPSPHVFLAVMTFGGVLLLAPPGNSTEPEAVPHQPSPASIQLRGQQLLADVAVLSRAYEGRQTGTAHDTGSASFVAERFQALGLVPAGIERLNGRPQSWFMTHPVNVVQILETPTLSITQGSEQRSARLGEDFLPCLDSPPINSTAPVVFVGYGIADTASGLNEYTGIDVSGKVALFLRGKPEDYQSTVTHTQKVRTAQDRGAIAYLTATGPVLSKYDARRGLPTGPMAFYNRNPHLAPETAPDRTLPGAWISTSLAESMLTGTGESLAARQHAIVATRRPQSVATNSTVGLSWDAVQSTGRLVNVLGLIPGQGSTLPVHQQPTVVVGAHRDHFGRHGGMLFPGADDNASGTAILLEAARILMQPPFRSLRAILFMSFSGEEQGLLGSQLYIRHPVRPLAQTVAMVNVDHAGVGNGRLTVGLSGLPQAVAIRAGERAGLADRLDLFGFFPGGDHVPFKNVGIPTVTIVSSGEHPHFHHPSDRVETVNQTILETTARYVATLVWALANERPVPQE